MYCDIRKAIFALGVLGVRDMRKRWTEISQIATETGSIASAVRSLAAFEAGAVDPHMVCGYEGVYIKAITGTPITMGGVPVNAQFARSIGADNYTPDAATAAEAAIAAITARPA